MFGYVTVCKNALSEQGLKTFKAYYCGLCKAIGKRCSQSARLGLSYDITFLAIVLSSVCKKEISMKDKIRYKFDADAIEMEGAAIAQVCKLDNMPFIVIRGISDSPNGNNEITFEQYLEIASQRCAEIINVFMQS